MYRAATCLTLYRKGLAAPWWGREVTKTTVVQIIDVDGDRFVVGVSTTVSYPNRDGVAGLGFEIQNSGGQDQFITACSIVMSCLDKQ